MDKLRFRLEVDLITCLDDDFDQLDGAAKGAADVLNESLDRMGADADLRFDVDSAKFSLIGRAA